MIYPLEYLYMDSRYCHTCIQSVDLVNSFRTEIYRNKIADTANVLCLAAV